jgi:cytochrome c oxidase cbb3-type subunit 3
MGPALMDDKWIYGSETATIRESIVNGRSNGMPAFGGRVTDEQAWQLAAYVRSMSGQLRKDVEPGRSDSMMAGEAEVARDREKPKAAPPPNTPPGNVLPPRGLGPTAEEARAVPPGASQ